MLPVKTFDTTWHATAAPAEPIENFVRGKSIFVTEVDNYDAYRSMLYALGAKGVANKMMAHVTLIIHGGLAAPAKAKTKYPNGEFVQAQNLWPLLHQEIQTFGGFIQALKKEGFTVRNFSDEGDPEFDFFDLPLVNNSLSDTLFHYLDTSAFIGGFALPDDRKPWHLDESYKPYKNWFYLGNSAALSRVGAQRGEGDYPLEISGSQLLSLAPAFWTQTSGLVYNSTQEIESVNGLFIQAGIDARTGRVNGLAVSRVWT